MNVKHCITLVLVVAALVAAGCFSPSNHEVKMDGYLDDKVTADRVENTLRHSSRMFAEIHVTSTNGVVYISGAVPTLALRQTAARLARRVEGVKEVRNELSIR